ncbi:MAG: cupin domain-containing protein [Pseudomonadota bacterium]|nr:cupin domain-containing protein [Pseudomonadota bacterium]
MKSTQLLSAGVCLALFGTGLATGLVANPASDSPQRVEKQRADLSGAPHMEVIASVAEYGPGERIDFHVHHGIEAAYVVQGAAIEVAGKAPTTLETGATVMNLRDIRHGGFTVVGERPLKLFTVHIVDKDKPLYDHRP